MPDSESVAIWCAGEDWCPVTATATMLGKKWHCVIIDRLLEHGPLGFNDLETQVDGISSKVLSEALEDLEEKRLVDRTIVSEKPFRVEYSLTEMGASLESLIEEMRDWGRTHLEATSDPDRSVA